MSEPNVEAVIKAAEQAQPAAPVQAPVKTVGLTTKSASQPVEPVAASDPRIANLMALGLSEEDAQKAIADVHRMWG